VLLNGHPIVNILSDESDKRSTWLVQSQQRFNRNKVLMTNITKPIQLSSVHENAPNNGRCNNQRKIGYKQPNNNMRAQNHEGQCLEYNVSLKCMEKDEIPEDNNDILG
ncbi:MAG: hypothetical protein EZS28_055391, partial [Streblomastix strix]